MTRPTESDDSMQEMLQLKAIAQATEAKMSPEEIALAVENSVKPSLESINLPTEILTKMLEETRGIYPTASRPKLCAELIRSFSDELFMKAAKELLDAGIPKAFALWFYVASGVMACAGYIDLAESRVSSGAEQTARRVSTLAGSAGLSASRGASVYLQLGLEAEKVSQLLMREPSGFSVIDHFLRGLEENGANRSIVAGGEFGVRLYKRAYELAKAENI